MGKIGVVRLMVLMNNRGEIPIVVLVIGVVAICVLSIASFSLSIFSVSRSFVGIDAMNSVNLFREQYDFYKNLGKTSEEIEEAFVEDVIKTDEDGNKYLFIGRVKVTSLSGEDFLFYVKYYLP